MTEETQKAAPSSISVPNKGMPVELIKALDAQLKARPPRGLAFQDRSQRNMAFLKKGLTKPGKISYDTLRRAALSVHVVRICIQTLKQKVTKTKWVIQNRDATKRKLKDDRIKEVMDLFRHPNQNNDTFRTLMDKMLEDLLALDAVSVEKTRFPDGGLAELFYVDSATIRPVYDEHGNQDIEIPLKTKDAAPDTEVLPVSYVQVLDNSQYGGPESGEIVAAWPKKDFLHFHMNPQGAMESFGYGLSPIEGILSVVANLLNADNFNSTYFEEGAFPPIILQLIGQVNQRDLEAYREYMVAELTGNFHRPAIMATEKADSLQVHNLKDMTNRDMQFMEYQLWLAKLTCAMFGMSPEDIGITDTTGSKSVSEVQQNISEQKGYSSILNLFEEVFNQEIIWKDFGFEDLEFHWVATDQQSPEEASTTFDRDLRNGTRTINEVREKRGDTPFGPWADEPMLLGGDGYKPLDPDKAREQQEQDMRDQQDMMEQKQKIVGGEKPYNEQGNKPDVEKSMKTLYISRPILNADDIISWARKAGFKTTLLPSDMHVTIAYSKNPVEWDKLHLEGGMVVSSTAGRSVEKFGKAIVLRFDDKHLQARWQQLKSAGASWDYKEYKPHISISFDAADMKLEGLIPYAGPIYLGAERQNEIDPEWGDKIQEKTAKSVFTPGGYKTWFDDRGYGQPFICMDIKSGTGQVIKPPAAVNLQSQQLEVDLTNQLAGMGLNVKPVLKMTYIEVVNMLRSRPDVLIEFEKYCNMTPEYDSEKWRAKFGGSRKFAYYLVSDYIDGYNLANPLLIADMKRDPNSYRQAVIDLGNLWRIERELVLGDRRADQYIITHDKRAYGIDYQFKGDMVRWERSKNAVRDALATVPELEAQFGREVDKKDEGMFKSIIKKLTGRV